MSCLICWISPMRKSLRGFKIAAQNWNVILKKCAMILPQQEHYKQRKQSARNCIVDIRTVDEMCSVILSHEQVKHIHSSVRLKMKRKLHLIAPGKLSRLYKKRCKNIYHKGIHYKDVHFLDFNICIWCSCMHAHLKDGNMKSAVLSLRNMNSSLQVKINWQNLCYDSSADKLWKICLKTSFVLAVRLVIDFTNWSFGITNPLTNNFTFNSNVANVAIFDWKSSHFDS